MRAQKLALAIAVILIGVAAARNKPVTAAHTDLYKAHDVVIYDLEIALPDGMTTFPAELVPLP